MTAIHNPEAAADQARAAYRNMTDQLGHLGLDTAVPEGVRALAEKSVAQTREAYDRSNDAFDASVTTFERSFDASGQGAAAFNRKIIDIARRNLNSSFDLAKSLAGAKNLADMVELQAAFWRKQFGALTAQAEEVRALSTKVTADAAEPIKEHVGTKLDHDSPAYKALAEKHSYTGPATVFGQNYSQANYAPLMSADGKLTGALFVGVPK